MLPYEQDWLNAYYRAIADEQWFPTYPSPTDSRQEERDKQEKLIFVLIHGSWADVSF